MLRRKEVECDVRKTGAIEGACCSTPGCAAARMDSARAAAVCQGPSEQAVEHLLEQSAFAQLHTQVDRAQDAVCPSPAIQVVKGAAGGEVAASRRRLLRRSPPHDAAVTTHDPPILTLQRNHGKAARAGTPRPPRLQRAGRGCTLVRPQHLHWLPCPWLLLRRCRCCLHSRLPGPADCEAAGGALRAGTGRVCASFGLTHEQHHIFSQHLCCLSFPHSSCNRCCRLPPPLGVPAPLTAARGQCCARRPHCTGLCRTCAAGAAAAVFLLCKRRRGLQQAPGCRAVGGERWRRHAC